MLKSCLQSLKLLLRYPAYRSVVTSKSAQERATRVRACNYVKIETGRNFLPVLKIVTHTAQAANVNVAKHARDQCSIFSTVQ